MESVVLIVICALLLYQLSIRQNKMADKMFGETFQKFERRYNSISYCCPEATVVKKQVRSFPAMPLVPAVNYTATALCLTEDNHWFWFKASIRHMKVATTSITPISQKDATEALSDDPEALVQYFPKEAKSNRKPETTS